MTHELALAEIIRTRLLGVHPDEQDVVLEDDDWRIILAALASKPALDPATIEHCARIAYLACAKTRHVTLGDKVASAIRASVEQQATPDTE